MPLPKGDKVEVEIKFGWSVNGFGLGDLTAVIDTVPEEEVAELVEEYKKLYDIPDQSAEAMASVAVQARYEIGIEKFPEGRRLWCLHYNFRESERAGNSCRDWQYSG